MPQNWSEDPALVRLSADSLLRLMAVFPRGIVSPDRLVRQSGMPFSGIQLLILLRDREYSIAELSEKLLIAKPNLTPLADKLVEDGLAVRRRGDADRRTVILAITEAGRERTDRIAEAAGTAFAESAEKLNRSEIKEWNKAVNTLLRLSGSMHG